MTIPEIPNWTMASDSQVALDGRGRHMIVPISVSKEDVPGWAFFSWPKAGDEIAAIQTELYDPNEIVLGVSLNAAGTTALVMTSPNYGVRRARIYTIDQGRMTHRQTITLPAGWWEWHLRSDQPGMLVGAGDGVVRAYGPCEPVAEPVAPSAIAMIRR